MTTPTACDGNPYASLGGYRDFHYERFSIIAAISLRYLVLWYGHAGAPGRSGFTLDHENLQTHLSSGIPGMALYEWILHEARLSWCGLVAYKSC